MKGKIAYTIAMSLLTSFAVNTIPEKAVGDTSDILSVKCETNIGCFGLIEEAILNAGPGTVIDISPGNYYEKPLLIDKSLTFQGQNEFNQPTTKITFVDPDVGFQIKSDSALIVVLKNLEIFAQAKDVLLLNEEGIGIQITGGSSDLDVTLDNVLVRSYIGVVLNNSDVHGFKVNIQNSIILAAEGVKSTANGDITLQKDNVLGPLGSLNFNTSIFTGNGLVFNAPSGEARVVLNQNDIEGFQYGIYGIADADLGSGQLTLTMNSNQISINHAGGVLLAGDKVSADLNNNFVTQNDGYGITLLDPVCANNFPKSVQFNGSITGTGNKVDENTSGDLCPKDYPLPPGFFAK
jgi:hypothetical protein